MEVARMISIDGSLFIQIANFLLMIFVLNILVYKPIRGVLRQRKEKIEGLEAGIENLIGEAEEKKEAFSSGIKNARTRGLKEKEALIQAAADEEKAILEKISIKAQEELISVRKKIVDEMESVRASLFKQTNEFAKQIGEKILGRAV
jgi:F-type H+-transporting ATPase subunit b